MACLVSALILQLCKQLRGSGSCLRNCSLHTHKKNDKNGLKKIKKV